MNVCYATCLEISMEKIKKQSTSEKEKKSCNVEMLKL